MEKFSLRRIPSRSSSLADDVRAGLTATPKSIPPRWFYDELGSALFDAICLLPEYYVTRAETEIFTRHAAEMVAALGRPDRIVELGSGTARKTRLLLEHAGHCEYVPVDIDCATVEKTGRALADEFDTVRVTSVCGDFTDPASILGSLPPADRSAVLFLGSTIGNLDHGAAAALLSGIRSNLRAGDRLLVGADLRKDSAILHAAYNDAVGVTAAFNLNLLQRINRELGGNFDLSAFRHRAVFDEELGRIEMYLDSARDQTAILARLGLTVTLREGEAIHTENSWKYTSDELAGLGHECGFASERSWTDSKGWFADVLFVAR